MLLVAVYGLVSITSGVVTAISANKDEAYAIGQSAAYSITGIYYNVSSVMLQCCSLWGQEVRLNPTLLFVYGLYVITNHAEIAKYLNSVKRNVYLNNRKHKAELVHFLNNTLDLNLITSYQSYNDDDTLDYGTAIACQLFLLAMTPT